jgi:hypothetical protein
VDMIMAELTPRPGRFRYWTGYIMSDRDPSVGQCPLMQSTGLFDKNGREIFEGDICRVDHLDPRYPVTNVLITWDASQAGWSVGIGLPSEVNWSHEVIGNLFENPDLLEDAAGVGAPPGRVAPGG